MKQSFWSRLSKLACLGVCLGMSLITSCDTKPFTPSNEVNNKLHENPHKVIYTLSEYRLEEAEHFHYHDIEDFEPVGNPQRLVWSIQSDGSWAFEGGKQEFVIKTAKHDPLAIYKLSIEHFNAQGVSMNHQFIDNGQSNIHQYTFSIYRDGLAVRNRSKVPYEYIYADKDAKTGKLLGENNPIGMEGFFRFKEEMGLEEIHAILLHAYESKYKDGIPSPYFAKLSGISGTEDISVKLTFRPVGNTDKVGDKTGGKEDTTPPNQPNDNAQGNSMAYNVADVSKVELFFAAGHFHGSSFHYLQGVQGLKYKNLAEEQSLTATWQEDKWVFSGEVDKFFVKASKLYSGSNFPAPSYGLWITYYDKSGKVLNKAFVDGGKHQTFFRPSDIKSIATQQALEIKPEELITYHYRDTKPWDAISKNQGESIGASDPVGLKGFFFTSKSGLQFTLNIELWSTPEGKRAHSSDALSGFAMPSQHIQSTGRCLLRLPVPVYLWLSKDAVERITPNDEDELYEDFPAEFSPSERETTEAIIKLLGTDFKTLQRVLYKATWGEKATEGSGGVQRWL